MPEDMKDYDKNWKMQQYGNQMKKYNNNKKGGEYMKMNEKTGYMMICGKCVDPCNLKFKPAIDGK